MKLAQLIRKTPISFTACVPLLCCHPDDPTTKCAQPRACSETAPVSLVCIDAAFTPIEQPQVRRAITQWDAVLCDTHRLEAAVVDVEPGIPDQCAYAILRVESWYEWLESRPDRTVAFSDVDRGLTWIIVDVVPAGLLRAAASHELGAMLGAGDDEGSGVMGEPLRDVCIWEASAAQARSALEGR